MKETYYDHTSEPEKEIECEACQIKIPETEELKDATPLVIAKLLSKEEVMHRIKNGMITAWVEVRNSNFIFFVSLDEIPDWYFNHGYYGRRWRLWDVKPSEVQMENTEWEEL